jgi:hypothetical protein
MDVMLALATWLNRARAELKATRYVNENCDWNHISQGAQVKIYWQGAYERSSELAQARVYEERRQRVETALIDAVGTPEGKAPP